MTNIGKRIREIRTNLNLKQVPFGEKIGVSQKVITNIETGTTALTDRNFNAICDVFNVNPKWLRTGEGEMFNPPPEDKWLDDLAKRKGLTSEEKALIGSIIELPPSARKAVIDWAFKLVESVGTRNTKNQQMSESTPEDPQEKRRRDLLEQRAQIDAELATLDGGSAIAKESLDIAG